ncbi:MAG TPA: hypothetical protein VHK27_05490 [Gammaproteobacteria bacterium]|nr:hypothetical protein [Gammaproteobacteria bacterium]
MPDKIAKAVYAGKRMTKSNKLAFCWLFENEAEFRLYSKQIAPATIGESWQFTQRDDSILLGAEHRPIVLTDPRDSRQTKWEAEQQLSIQLVEEHKANKRLESRLSGFETAVKPLHRMCAALRYHEDREAFIRRVCSELRKPL